MRTIVGILTFMCSIIFMLSRVEHGFFIPLGPGLFHILAIETTVTEPSGSFGRALDWGLKSC